MRFKYFILIIVLSACSKHKNYNQILLIGHGGNGLEIQSSFYHDNTLEAVNFAFNIQGVDGVELDLRLSADGECWFYHDDELENETNGSGCLESFSSEELENLVYSTSKKEKLLCLNDFDVSGYAGKTIVFDLRHYNPCDAQFIDKSILRSKLQEFKNTYPEIHLKLNCKIASVAEYFANSGFDVFIEVEQLSDYKNNSILLLNVHGVTIDNLNVTHDEINDFRNKYNKKVVIFGPRSPKFIRKALKKQPDFLITDDLRTAIIEKY